MKDKKVVILDWGIFTHRAGYATVKSPMSATYTCLNMMLSNLKLIGLNDDDLILIACDGRGNWRKELDLKYKQTRKKKREESPVDWKTLWPKFDWLLKQLSYSTNWKYIKLNRIEADDIMAVLSRYFWDREVILVTYDSDMEQLWHYNYVSNCCQAPTEYNTEKEGDICLKCKEVCEIERINRVKIFSPHPKSKRYKLMPKDFNAYQVIMSKINKEISDDLVDAVQNEEQFEVRKQLVDLINLPKWVRKEVIEALRQLPKTRYNMEKFPYPKLLKSLEAAYEKSHVLTYEECEKKQNKKRRKRK